MKDCGDCIAADANILTVKSVALLSDCPDSRLLAHDVVAMFSLLLAVVINEYSILAKCTIMLLTALHCASCAPMLPHYYYAQNYASIISQGLT